MAPYSPQARLLRESEHRNGHAAHVAPTDDHVDLVLVKQPAGGGQALLGLAFSVVEGPLDLPAEHPALRVDLLHRQLHAGFHVLAQECGGSGDRQNRPDLDRGLRVDRGGRNAERERQQGCLEEGSCFHCWVLLGE